VLDFEPLPRRGDQRFRRYAAAITQAEIRRLSRAQRAAQLPLHDTMASVQHELRRLSHPGAAAAADPGRETVVCPRPTDSRKRSSDRGLLIRDPCERLVTTG
jgi:hypothetical protein